MTIHSRFPDQEACIEHLERVRWGDEPWCPLCGCLNVKPKADGDRVGRWNCHDCKSSFNVLSGTIFEKTRIELPYWFMAIGLIVNAKKSLSSCQLARDLDITQQSAHYMQIRIRAAMATEQLPMLQGIIEADETYIGGRPRKGNKRKDDKPRPRGRGTDKTPVIGVVERGGKVVAQVANKVNGKRILKFVKSAVDPTGSLLITDEFKAYRAVRPLMSHAVIKHRKQYVDGLTHTNTIEGFWSLLKRAWYGSHHHYGDRFMPLYVAEACWKYNHRKSDNAFGDFIGECFA
ncbi:MAG: IS1595 family transposase [Bryobacterales bacterium]|nr:IS1595 family transposase [Bryobacterales bacterium]